MKNLLFLLLLLFFTTGSQAQSEVMALGDIVHQSHPTAEHLKGQLQLQFYNDKREVMDGYEIIEVAYTQSSGGKKAWIEHDNGKLKQSSVDHFASYPGTWFTLHVKYKRPNGVEAKAAIEFEVLP